MNRKGFGGFWHEDEPFEQRPFGPGGRGPGRFRQRRGDIRFVLLELLKDEPHHGYELIKAMEERSGGFYRPSPGVIYPTLQLLEEEGNVTSKMVEDKRVYTITDAGRKLLEEQEASERGHRWEHHLGPDVMQLHELHHIMAGLFQSVMQAARYGTPEQVKAVKALIESTNKDVHAILSQDRPSDKV